MAEDTDISKLLKMKRYEEPPAGRVDDFLREFHRRQRAELLRPSISEILWERLMAIAPSFRVPQLAYAAIVALAVSVSALILTQQPKPGPALAKAGPESAPPALSLASSKPVTISGAVPVSTRMSGSMPSHYVLQSRPVSNEQPLSF